MFNHGVQPTTINSGTSFTNVVDIRGCNYVAVELPTISTFLTTATANVFFNVCNTSTGTFRRLQTMGIYSSNSGVQDIEVPSTGGNKMVYVPQLGGFNYAKVEFNNVCTATASINVHKIQ